jgi:DNA topoisomerase-1
MTAEAPKKKVMRIADSDDSDEDMPLARRLSQEKSPSVLNTKVAEAVASDDSDQEGTDPNASSGSEAEDASGDDGSSGGSASDDDASSDEDVPLAKRQSRPAPSKLKRPENEDIDDDDEAGDSDDDVPLSARAKSKKPVKAQKKRPVASDADSSDEDVPLSVAANKRLKASANGKAVKTTNAAAAGPKETKAKVTKSPRKKKAEEEEEEVYKWWENHNQDDSVKWNHLEHSGVLFPPPYEPHGIKMKYEGQEVTLSPASEEVAGFFAQLVGTQYAENETFCKNFFADFRAVLKKHDPDCPIREFAKCDFTPMTEYFAQQRELKKQMTKAEKERIKEEKKEIERQYGYATVDGRKEKVGNFRIEPPGLFRGRGDHPKTGKLKVSMISVFGILYIYFFSCAFSRNKLQSISARKPRCLNRQLDIAGAASSMTIPWHG